MKRFESPNILRMFGICVQDENGVSATSVLFLLTLSSLSVYHFDICVHACMCFLWLLYVWSSCYSSKSLKQVYEYDQQHIQ